MLSQSFAPTTPTTECEGCREQRNSGMLLATLLLKRHLTVEPAAPRCPPRDRFNLSAWHGLAKSVGIAMAEEHLRARWGPKMQDDNTYRIAGHGGLMEGVSPRVIGMAGHQRCSRLIVL